MNTGFKTATVISWNSKSKQGVAVDAFEYFIHFDARDLYYLDLPGIHKGVQVVVNSEGKIELADASFVRWEIRHED